MTPSFPELVGHVKVELGDYGDETMVWSFTLTLVGTWHLRWSTIRSRLQIKLQQQRMQKVQSQVVHQHLSSLSLVWQTLDGPALPDGIRPPPSVVQPKPPRYGRGMSIQYSGWPSPGKNGKLQPHLHTQLSWVWS